MRPPWLDRLGSDPEAWQDFIQWIEGRKRAATDEVLRAPSWEATIAARAKLEAYVDLHQVATAADREEQSRERYRGQATRRTG